jgi:hypothetical protein
MVGLKKESCFGGVFLSSEKREVAASKKAGMSDGSWKDLRLEKQ